MAGIGGVSAYNQIEFNSFSAMNKIASGKKINSAADDAAGLAIAKGLENQSAGAKQASNNAQDMKNLMNLSGGALGQISDGLERIRELTVQSQNGIYSSSDKAIFQDEIQGILDGINDIGKNTNYNGKSVLDGSFTAQNAAIGPNGESMQINIGGSLTDQLGLAGYNVTNGNYSLDALDQAIEAVSTQQAEIGAYSNRLDYSSKVMDNAAYNMEVARSRKEDADIAEASMENNRQRITEQVGLEVQKLKMQSMGNFLSLIS